MAIKVWRSQQMLDALAITAVLAATAAYVAILLA